MADAQPDAKLVLWEGVNHVLKVAPADRVANIANYNDPSLPLAPVSSVRQLQHDMSLDQSIPEQY